MNLWDWLAAKVLDRVGSLFAAWVASSAETRLLHAQMDELARLEQRADELQQQGKEQLAQMLRRRAAQLAVERPAESALDVIDNFALDEAIVTRAIDATDSSQPDEGQGPTREALPAPKKVGKKRGRPANQNQKPMEKADD